MKYLVLFLVGFSFLSCSQKSFENREELLSYIKDPESGYYQSKNVNGLDASLLYRPTDLMVVQELDGNNSSTSIESIRNRYKNFHYFNLSLSKNGKEVLSVAPNSQKEFGAMVNQLAFGMGENIHLYTDKKDTIPMTDYIYPRMYGMSGSTTLILVFPKTKKTMDCEYLTLAIEDFGLNTGEIKFKISNEVLENEPMLSFK